MPVPRHTFIITSAFPATWAVSSCFTLDTVLSMSLNQNTLARVETSSLLKDLLISKSLLNTALPRNRNGQFYSMENRPNLKQIYLPFTTRSPRTFPFCMKASQNWLISSTRGLPPALGIITFSSTIILFLMWTGFVNLFLPVTCKTRLSHSRNLC